MKLLTKTKRMIRGKYKDNIGCAWFQRGNNKNECTIDGKVCRYFRDTIERCKYFENSVLPQDEKLMDKYNHKIKELLNE